jgi:hypothetical protein
LSFIVRPLSNVSSRILMMTEGGVRDMSNDDARVQSLRAHVTGIQAQWWTIHLSASSLIAIVPRKLAFAISFRLAMPTSQTRPEKQLYPLWLPGVVYQRERETVSCSRDCLGRFDLTVAVFLMHEVFPQRNSPLSVVIV